MHGSNTVSVIFSAGAHTPMPTLLGALLFLIIRVVAVLLLPGLVLLYIGMFICDRLGISGE
jgi:hypothetical protein